MVVALARFEVIILGLGKWKPGCGDDVMYARPPIPSLIIGNVKGLYTTAPGALEGTQISIILLLSNAYQRCSRAAFFTGWPVGSLL
jgi:hypothetical protein